MFMYLFLLALCHKINWIGLHMSAPMMQFCKEEVKVEAPGSPNAKTETVL